jgi:hypothetical protein
MTNQFEGIIKKAYSAFNERDIDKALSTMKPDVQWSKAWEGGYINGHNEIKEYWTRQWTEINPTVEPVGFTETENGSLEVKVHQNVKDLQGNLIFDGSVKHIYTFQDGFIKTMDIELFEKDGEKSSMDTKVTPANNNDQFVIPDECGDTLWDAVLKQEEEKDKLAAEKKK